MKKSEAKILIYLDVADKERRYLRKIAAKLQIDYAYTSNIIDQMMEKKWITRISLNGKSFFTTTLEAPIKAAKERVQGP